ncbi:MAG: OsmC family peroxiredoxin [Saprospiraceae bacterium]|nr:OsmC family peroxiredoxin [Saprospiraceae bacterium]
MKRKATAVWHGGGPEGTGTLTTMSGAFKEHPYSAKLRFQNEDGKEGTNPEELVAAAHAGCFNMALAFKLSAAGLEPEELQTQAVLTMEKLEAGWTIQSILLKLEAKIPGLSEGQFQEYAASAKAGCPISRLLKCDIELEAKLLI